MRKTKRKNLNRGDVLFDRSVTRLDKDRTKDLEIRN